MKKFSLVLALVLTVGLLGAAPAAAWEPRPGAKFNVPNPWGSYKANYEIVRGVEAAIGHVKGPTKRRPNPTIHISTYLMDRGRTVEKLVAACRRGVSVRVILDEDIANKKSRRLIRVLNADNVRDRNRDGKADRRPKRGPCDTKLKKKRKPGAKGGKNGGKHGGKHGGKGNGAKGKGAKGGKGRMLAPPALTKGDRLSERPKSPPLTAAAAMRSVKRPHTAVTWGRDKSYVKKCDGSCRGAGGNMHSKFFLFSRSGTASHVVIVSSSNLNRGGARLGWNDSYTMVDRRRSYRAYVRIHRDMTHDQRAGDRKVQVRDGRYTSRFFPMRRASKRTDPTLHDLEKVRCKSGFGRTRVNVSMFYWKGARGNYLTSRLFDMARHGCKVSIVYGAPSLQMAERLRNAARRKLIKLYDSRWDFNDDGTSEVRTHSKYVLVRGTFGRHKKAFVVMTGSQNWVAGSLKKSDETTLNIAKKRAYKQYLRHWKKVRNHSRRLPYNW